MSAPALAAGGWAVVLSLNVDNELSAGLVPSRVSDGFASALRQLGASFPSQPSNAPNPVTSVAPVFGRSRSVVTLACSLMVVRPVEGRAVNRAFAEAFKNGGAGGGLSVTRIAAGLDTDANIGEAFAWSPAVGQCSADYRHTGEFPAVGVTSALGSTAAAAGTGPITNSDNPALIGSRPPAAGGSVLDDFRGFLNAVPIGYKVAGAAVIAVAGTVAVGYARRSFK